MAAFAMGEKLDGGIQQIMMPGPDKNLHFRIKPASETNPGRAMFTLFRGLQFWLKLEGEPGFQLPVHIILA
jgi:hypothetical protein